MTESPSKTPLRYRIAPAFAAVFLLLSSLPMVFAMVDDHTFVPAGFLGLGLLFLSMLANWLGAFTALIMRTWSRWPALIGLILLLPLWLPLGLLEDKYGLIVFWGFGLLGTMTLFVPDVRTHMTSKASMGAGAVVANALKLAVGSVVVVALLIFAGWTLWEVRTTARTGQTEELCNQGNHMACAYLAQKELESATTVTETLASLKKLDDLCDQKSATGCHESAWGGRTLKRNYRADPKSAETAAESMESMLYDVASKACKLGDERACFVQKFETPMMSRPVALRELLAGLCDDDKIWACRTAVYVQVSEDEIPEFQKRACAAGFVEECLNILETHPKSRWKDSKRAV